MHPGMSTSRCDGWRRLFGLIAVLIITAPALARGDVDFRFGRREAWVGQSFPIQVEVINAADHDPPAPPSIDGATSEVLDGANTSTFTQIINGRRTTRSTTTYTIMVRPERAGVIEIPPIEVKVDGEVFRSEPWRIVATRSEVGDLMFVDILSDPDTAWVGEPVTLTLQLWLKQFRDASQGIALEEESMWSLVDQTDSTWGIFAESLDEMRRERRRPRGREVERNGASYFLYEIPVVRHPIDAGRIDPGDVRVVFQQPLGLRARRDFFGRREFTIDGSRPIVVDATMPPVDVRPLPSDGRPAEFTGAVGRFRVEAYAEPREVSVGDPITLVLEVTDIGTGSPVDLANLRPPRLQSDPALDGFRLPDSPTTGVVEGRTKIFTETLRPERDDLTEIPGIAFASFDPTLDRYVVVRTSPIPISVSPSERIDLGEAVRGGAAPLALGGPAGTSLTAAGGTLRANRPIDVAILGTAPVRLTAPLAIASTAPVAVLVAAAVRRRRAHREANPHLVRASSARGRANRRLDDDGPVADRVLDAICGLVAARMHRTDGALTARETIELAEAAGLDEASLEALRDTLHAAETARYATGTVERDRELVEHARSLLPALDRLRPAGGRR